MPTPNEVLANLRRKYPMYAALSDQELVRRIVAKYPQYTPYFGGVGSAAPSVAPPAEQPIRRNVYGLPAGNYRPFEIIRGTAPIDVRVPRIVSDIGRALTAAGGFAAVGSPALGGGPATESAIAGATGVLGRKIGGMLTRGAPVAATQAPAAEAAVVETATQKVIRALRAARPVREAQEIMYTAERGKRLAAASALAEGEPTLAGTRKALGALRGPLPKPQFTPLQIDDIEGTATELIKQIRAHPQLTGFEKLRAQAGLGKLFGVYGGAVPQESELGLLQKVFGSEFTKEVMAKRGVIAKAQNAASVIAGTAKALASAFDMSGGGRQAIFAAPRFPVEFARAFRDQFKMFFSKSAYQGIMQGIRDAPEIELAQRGRLALTGLEDLGINREEVYVASQLAERIPMAGPIVRASNRAFSGLLTKFRFDIFKRMLRDAQQMGLEVTDERLQAIASFINTATGRGDLKGGLASAANALSTAIWSPRLVASRVRLINPMYFVGQRDPLVRKYAIQSALAFYSSVTTGLWLTALAGKQAGIKVGTDLRSADFGKILIPDAGLVGTAGRIAGAPAAFFGVGVQRYGGYTRFDLTGGLQGYLRLIGQLYAGQAISSVSGQPITERGKPLSRWRLLQRFVEQKFSPVLGAAKDLTDEAYGSRFMTPIQQRVSQRTGLSGTTVARGQDVLRRFVFMFLQDAYDLLFGGE